MTGPSPAGTYRLEVTGELDLSTTPGMVDAALAPRSAREVVIDLTAVTFIDAAGVGGLVTMRSALTATGRRLRVVGTTPRTLRVLALARAEFLLDQPRPDPSVLDQLTAAVIVAVRAAPLPVRRRACRPELVATR